MFKFMELSDLYADACIRDESNNLMFLSIYGRDTAIHQMMAAFQLGRSEGGLHAFRLLDEGSGQVHPVSIGQSDRLTKFTGRLPRENLFGNLVHAWIYDPVLLQPDKASRIAWILMDEPFSEASRDHLQRLVWEAYKALSPLPLLDSWREVVLRATESICLTFMEATSFPPLGDVSAVRIALPDSFADDLSSMVKSGMVGIEGEEARWIESARHEHRRRPGMTA